jgi:hypothetical protein
METGLAARAFFNGSEKAVGGEVREGSAVEDQCEKRAVSKADGAPAPRGGRGSIVPARGCPPDRVE